MLTSWSFFQSLVIAILLELFSVNYCNGLRIFTSTQYDIKSLNFLGLDTDKTSHITFQVVACSDVISGSSDPRYEFAIGGWANTKSEVRRGKEAIRSLNHTPLDCCVFKAFWISWNETTLSAGYGLNVGYSAFFEIMDTDMTKVIDVGVTTGWSHAGVWAMSFDNSPLKPSDYDVKGYVECPRQTVTYYIPMYPTSSDIAYPTSLDIAYLSSSEILYSSFTMIDLRLSEAQSTILTKTTLMIRDSSCLSREKDMTSYRSNFMMVESSVLTTEFPFLASLGLITSEPTPVITDSTFPTSGLNMRTMSLLDSEMSSYTWMEETISPTTTSILDVTSPSPVTLVTITTDGRACVGCQCGWPLYGLVNLTLDQKIERIRESLTLVKSNLSAVRRRLTSAYDVRPSSRYMGASGATILVLVIGLIVLVDVQRVLECLMDRKKGVLGTSLTRTSA